jgi:hypothetical protein
MPNLADFPLKLLHATQSPMTCVDPLGGTQHRTIAGEALHVPGTSSATCVLSVHVCVCAAVKGRGNGASTPTTAAAAAMAALNPTAGPRCATNALQPIRGHAMANDVPSILCPPSCENVLREPLLSRRH